MFSDYLRRILNARIYDLAKVTPLDRLPQLSKNLTNTVLLKREDLQVIFSFKIRGAFNKIRQLSDEERKLGVVAASAGNHAQGVAIAAHRLGVKATIVMPLATPQIKINAVKRLGGIVKLHGDAFDEAAKLANIIAQDQGMIFIHPFDDKEVIAGQGTVAMEILQQLSGPIDAIFIPVGGGGLCAGISVFFKTVQPNIRIIAVEVEDSACLKAALEADKTIVLDHVGLFAEGVAVAKIGEENFRILRETVDEVITVNTDEICVAINDIFEDTRSITEPAGALSVAGMKKYVDKYQIKNQVLITIASGANIDFNRLRYVSERNEASEVLLAVNIPEKPGSFRKFCAAIGKRTITEFNYRYHSKENASIFVGLKLDSGTTNDLISRLSTDGFLAVDITHDEIAKLHIRHMVGGKARDIAHEHVFAVSFPERPGALMNFLNSIDNGINISLFHYRNHGSAFGRVLMGVIATQDQLRTYRQELDGVKYEYEEVTENEAYKFFLG